MVPLAPCNELNDVCLRNGVVGRSPELRALRTGGFVLPGTWAMGDEGGKAVETDVEDRVALFVD